MTDGPMLVPGWVSVRPGGLTQGAMAARPSSAPSSPPSSRTFSPLDPLGLHVDTTALTELIEPVAAAGAAIFFAASKAGRDIRLHTASGGRRVHRCAPTSTRIPWQRLRSPCGHERQRPFRSSDRGGL